MYVEVCVSYQMYVMYVCWSMCKLSDVCNVCMLKSVRYQMCVCVCVCVRIYLENATVKIILHFRYCV